MTQEPKKNGGREQSFMDTLSEKQRALVTYVHGMPDLMQSAWTISQISGIHGILEDFTSKALAAQSKATTEALAAANPPKVVNGDWKLTAAQRAWFVAVGGALVMGAIGALQALGLA